MTEVRKDPFSDARIIYSPEREGRPDYTGVERKIVLKPENCPFCEGNEDMTPPEIFSVREVGNKNEPGWMVRVIPNKFPVLGIEGEASAGRSGCYENMTGVGAHEVIIETPNHELSVKNQTESFYKNLFSTFRERVADLKRDKRFRYIQVFKNHGPLAGATISHHHSQIIALSFVPVTIETRLKSAHRFHEEKKRSLFKEILNTEKDFGLRMICENNSFAAFSPYYSPSPFFISIFQKKGEPRFEDMAEKKLEDLSDIYSKLIKKVDSALASPSFNFSLNNSPFGLDCGNYYSWTIDLSPVITGTGGFEASTGCFINSFFPEKAAEILRRF